jgi:hypothetical protein
MLLPKRGVCVFELGPVGAAETKRGSMAFAISGPPGVVDANAARASRVESGTVYELGNS